MLPPIFCISRTSLSSKFVRGLPNLHHYPYRRQISQHILKYLAIIFNTIAKEIITICTYIFDEETRKLLFGDVLCYLSRWVS